MTDLYDVKQKIISSDINKFKEIDESTNFTNSQLCELVVFAANSYSFAVLEYLLNQYADILDPELLRGETIKLAKPIDITSYNHARYLITKQLLEKYNIKYLLL